MKNFKLFGFIHIADIILLGLLAALIWGAVQFSVPRQVQARAGDVPLRVTIELGQPRAPGEERLIQAGFHRQITVGERLFEAQQGVEIGTIVDVYAKPYQVEFFDEARGVIRRVDVDGLEYVYIVADVMAQVSDYETVVGRLPVAIGRAVTVRSRDFAGEGFIVAIESR